MTGARPSTDAESAGGAARRSDRQDHRRNWIGKREMIRQEQGTHRLKPATCWCWCASATASSTRCRAA